MRISPIVVQVLPVPESPSRITNCNHGCPSKINVESCKKCEEKCLFVSAAATALNVTAEGDPVGDPDTVMLGASCLLKGNGVCISQDANLSV